MNKKEKEAYNKLKRTVTLFLDSIRSFEYTDEQKSEIFDQQESGREMIYNQLFKELEEQTKD